MTKFRFLAKSETTFEVNFSQDERYVESDSLESRNQRNPKGCFKVSDLSGRSASTTRRTRVEPLKLKEKKNHEIVNRILGYIEYFSRLMDCGNRLLRR